jgi:hypothetical protein
MDNKVVVMPKQPGAAVRRPLRLRIGSTEYEIQIDVRMTPVKRKGEALSVIGRQAGGEVRAENTPS